MAVSRGDRHWLEPDWDVPKSIRAITTTAAAGNLAGHVGDDPEHVRASRQRLVALAGLPSMPRWLDQVHSPVIMNADYADESTSADGAWTSTRGVVCAVLTADCLPVLFGDRQGRFVAAAHAGWRGMCSGVLDLTIQRFFEMDVAPQDIVAWLGPAIGADSYEVDAAVRDVFLQRDPDCEGSFAVTREGHWQFDLCAAARTILAAQGVMAVSGGGFCTYSDEQFDSYRRNPDCGRQATLIWLD